MPEISRFLGICIYMYYKEHAPPHFHAGYGEFEITINIKDGIIEGKFPRRALKHVLEWYPPHKEELLKNWDKARLEQELKKIEPLE